jgi:hypothetical protein
VAAQFNPMRAASLRSERTSKGIDSDFQVVGVCHRALA